MNETTRRMAVRNWLDDRTGVLTWYARYVRGTISPRWWLGSFWPSLIVFAFVLQVITGLVLWMNYTPSANSAWESVYYIQYELSGGWFVRGIHHYAAQTLVALCGLYVVQLVLLAAYRKPREFVFWIAVAMGLTSLALCLTGDLLKWDENGLAATQTRASFLMLLPAAGAWLRSLVLGGSFIGHLTLARFFALHVGVFAAGFLGLLVLHHHFRRRADRQQAEVSGIPHWPLQCWRNVSGCAVVMIVILLLIFQDALIGGRQGRPPGQYLGAQLGAPADRDPANAYEAARPEWSFRALHELLHYFSGPSQIVPIFVVPGAATAVIFLMPLVARIRFGHALNVAILLGLLAGAGFLTLESYRRDAVDADYQKAVQEGRRLAQRTVELARGQGIPPSGALQLLRRDPMLRGPRLFERHCASCHPYAKSPGELMRVDASAPVLHRIASPAWFAGLLTSEGFTSDVFHGNTRFAGGVMATWLRDHEDELNDEQRRAMAEALAAEAQLPDLPKPLDAELVQEGRELIVSAGCTDCHRFHEHGKRGATPDLTGFGSAAWLAGMIANPEHTAFYGLGNDAMPGYYASPEHPQGNRLSLEEIGILVSWLRGDWFKPGDSAAPSPNDDAMAFAIGRWAGSDQAPERAKPDSPKQLALAALRRGNCSLCHDYTGENGIGQAAHHPVAASLYGFATRSWLAGLLDPDQIAGPRYFGNSQRLSEGDMASHVIYTLPDLFAEVGASTLEALVQEATNSGKQAEFALEYLGSLRGEIGEEELKKRVAESVENGAFLEFVQQQVPDEAIEQLGRDKLAELIETLASLAEQDDPQQVDEQAVALFEAFGCADCHKFYGSGDLGMAPDLTGYGSRRWVIEMISNPEHKRFYPDTNGGMPAFRAFPNQPRKNLLSEEECQQIADLIRGRLGK